MGDRISVWGGYATNMDPEWMAAAGSDKRYDGTVVELIPGQNAQPAPVVELDEKIVLPAGAGAALDREVRGRYLVLEFGYSGADWSTPGPRVHVELCDFRPEPKRWQDRRQGAWVESHATWDFLDD